MASLFPWSGLTNSSNRAAAASWRPGATRLYVSIVDAAPPDCERVRYWDLAAMAPKPGKHPDWTIGCLMGKSQDNVLYVLHIARTRGTPGAIEALTRQTAEVDGLATRTRMEQEPGASGVKVIDDYTRRVLMGHNLRGVKSSGSKEARARPLASQAQAGNMKLVRGPWINAFLDEAELFPLGAHDDQVDAVSAALADLSAPANVSWCAVCGRRVPRPSCPPRLRGKCMSFAGLCDP